MRTYLFCFFLLACQSEENKNSSSDLPPAEENILTQKTEQGPVQATLSLWPKDLRLGDPLQLKL